MSLSWTEEFHAELLALIDRSGPWLRGVRNAYRTMPERCLLPARGAGGPLWGAEDYAA